jgi:manganese transport protein
VIVILLFGETEVDNLLVLSQVVLSVQLGFAVIPLIHFVSDKGRWANSPSGLLKASWPGCAALLVYLNMKLVIEEAALS